MHESDIYFYFGLSLTMVGSTLPGAGNRHGFSRAAAVGGGLSPWRGDTGDEDAAHPH